jgi:two-component system, NtrC family, response regulator GlrR
MPGAPEGGTTEVQVDVQLHLVGTRYCPRLTWTDAAGSHESALEGRLLLGSAPDAPLSVADRGVSRVHAELELRDDGVWIRDLGSRNGTWIDATRIAHARLAPGARFRAGATTFALSSDAEPTDVPLWPDERFGPLLARSDEMRELFMHLARYAQTDAPVLVRGETGTGKELVAQALHRASSRERGPFVVVDCAAIPEALVESELFGHARGAFTGAVGPRTGAIEAADRGTVFLDEIGELPASMQPKLLRVLETRAVRRVGETAPRQVDVRFVAATHRDLQAMVGQGAFREDLYFRLAVLPVYVPPLRERRCDVPLLLAHFLGRDAARLAPELVAALMDHPWPGNVRELRSFAERAKTLGAPRAWDVTRGAAGPTGPLTAPSVAPRSRLPLPAVVPDAPFKVLREQWTDHFERGYMSALVARHGRNVAAIAAEAELDSTYVRRLLRKHEL